MPTIIIDRACDCNVEKFMKACFDNKLKVLLIEGEATDEDLQKALELVYAEYVDASGLYETREFEMQAYIQMLHVRTTVVSEFVKLQRSYITYFGVPYVRAFHIAKKYGYSLYFDFEHTDIEGFLKKLDSIESKEKKYFIQKDIKEKEFFEFKKKQIKKEHTLLQSRKQFVSMLVRLQQQKFVINKSETTVEELAIMIREQRDQNEEDKARKYAKKY